MRLRVSDSELHGGVSDGIHCLMIDSAGNESSYAARRFNSRRRDVPVNESRLQSFVAVGWCGR